MTKRLWRTGLLALAMTILGLGACADAADDPAPLDFAQMPIFGGSSPNAPEHGAVVGLHRVRNGSAEASPFCSGTLVAADVVVTAGHCLDTAKGGKNFKTMPPSSLAIYAGGEQASSDPSPFLVMASETLIHPGYDRNALFDDIALVRTAVSVPPSVAEPVANLPSALGFRSSDVGALALNFAGFGVTEYNTSGVLLQADGLLGGLGCTVSGCYGADDPATQISYTQYNAGPCFGDSGGPAFLYRDGVPYLGGVTSWGDQYCTQFGVSTRVDAYQSWIDAFADGPPPGPDCSADGVCNAECAAGDDPDCSAAAACGDGTCGTGESCDGRNGTSACSADCAGKINGKKSERYCYVEGVCEGPGCP